MSEEIPKSVQISAASIRTAYAQFCIHKAYLEAWGFKINAISRYDVKITKQVIQEVSI